jgi:hypothetical protein
MKRDAHPRRGILKRLVLALAGLAMVAASSPQAEAARWRWGGGARRYGYGRAVARPRYWGGGFGAYRGYRPTFYNRGYFGGGGGYFGGGGFGAPMAPTFPYSSGVFPPVM